MILRVNATLTIAGRELFAWATIGVTVNPDTSIATCSFRAMFVTDRDGDQVTCSYDERRLLVDALRLAADAQLNGTANKPPPE